MSGDQTLLQSTSLAPTAAAPCHPQLTRMLLLSHPRNQGETGKLNPFTLLYTFYRRKIFAEVTEEACKARRTRSENQIHTTDGLLNHVLKNTASIEESSAAYKQFSLDGSWCFITFWRPEKPLQKGGGRHGQAQKLFTCPSCQISTAVQYLQLDLEIAGSIQGRQLGFNALPCLHACSLLSSSTKSIFFWRMRGIAHLNGVGGVN